MPKTIMIRKMARWEQVAAGTYALELPGGGVVLRHAQRRELWARSNTWDDGGGAALSESMVFIPQIPIDRIAPLEQRTICADGDPDCGDPDCERKHLPIGRMPGGVARELERFFVDAALGIEDDRSGVAHGLPPDWFVVIDQTKGVVAAAPSKAEAEKLRKLLRADAAGEG